MSTMAPRPNGPNNEGQKLPEKFRCKTGGEWKPWSSFSKKQQKLVQDKLSRRARIDAANTGMVCRIHSGEPVKEIQCEGPCNRILVLDKFSKNNRTNGVNPLAPITGTDGLTGLEDDETDVPSLKLAGLDISRTRRNIVPPRLDTESVASTRQTTGSITSKTTAQSSSEDLGKTSLWLSQAKIAQAQPSGRVTYNAWDSNGRQYQMSKTPTVQSGQSSVASSIAGASSSRSQALGNNRPNAVSNSRLQQSTNIGKATTGGTWARVANPDAGPAG
ncbi:hypothetical protein ColLi_05437 [Colletotrichum liriopes]|uniref:Stc1 domain-containing protein n=1 Tax=Colletotrichum liriopes TaxID=708192 RepID=A0AA37LRT9_9PEZI|nr:hypothetical protein ColLi_05437 [Colletotrichum liriopes]